MCFHTRSSQFRGLSVALFLLKSLKLLSTSALNFIRRENYLISKIFHTLILIAKYSVPPNLIIFVSCFCVRAVLIDHAEIALHNHFGNREYWRCRRSMRFAKHLEEVAKYFRATFLNSTDESDGINRPDDWTQEKVSGSYQWQFLQVGCSVFLPFKYFRIIDSR